MFRHANVLTFVLGVIQLVVAFTHIVGHVQNLPAQHLPGAEREGVRRWDADSMLGVYFGSLTHSLLACLEIRTVACKHTLTRDHMIVLSM
jgi:hypothetical protein